MIFYILNFLGIDTLTFLHWFLAVAITLLMLDCFTQTDFLSVLAIILFAEYFEGVLSKLIPLQWLVVVYVLLLILSFFIYVTLWRKFVYVFIRHTLLRNATRESYESMAGENGIFRIIDGKKFVDWNGELWQVECPNLYNFHNGEDVIILSNNNGKLTITKRK